MKLKISNLKFLLFVAFVPFAKAQLPTNNIAPSASAVMTNAAGSITSGNNLTVPGNLTVSGTFTGAVPIGSLPSTVHTNANPGNGITIVTNAPGQITISTNGQLTIPSAANVSGTLAVANGGIGNGTGNASSLTNINGAMLNPMGPPFNAVGDGVTDDTAAITNALWYGGLHGGIPVLLPMKTFKVTAPIVLYTNESLFGMRGSKLYFGTGGSSFTGAWLTADYQSTNVHISGLEIDGGGGTSTPGSDDGRIGFQIWADEQVNCEYSDIYVHGFGTGIRVFNLGANQATKAQIRNLTAYYDYTGIRVDADAEYIGFTSLYCFANHFGLCAYGGNDTYSSCHFTGNQVNVAFMGPSGTVDNSAHDMFSSCTFNHPGLFNVLATNVNFGALFSSCAFVAPPSSYFTNCQGFSFINCFMGESSSSEGFNFNHCTNCLVAFDQSPYAGGANGTGVTYSFTNCVNCFHLSANNATTNGIVLENSDFSLTGMLRLMNNTSTPSAGYVGTDNSVLWCSNGVLYTTCSANGSTATTTLLGNHP